MVQNSSNVDAVQMVPQMTPTTICFAANNESYRKRKRTHRACEQCKKKRRKCEPPHLNQERCATCLKDNTECSLVDPVTSTSLPAVLDTAAAPIVSNDSKYAETSSLEPSSQRRFIGDMNPEAVLLSATLNTKQADGQLQRDITSCGVWTGTGAASNSTAPKPRKPQNISRAYEAYLESIQAFNLPLKETQNALIDIFIESIHPLLPILDVVTFKAEYNKGTASLPLLLAVFLVAGKHPEAASLLPGGSIRDWASETALKIEALLNCNWETDRLTLVRINALLALHSEGPGGNELASLRLSNAIHHAFSAGLHLNREDLEKAQTEVELWWSLWAVDTFQAVLCGRPLTIRREDISLPLPSSDSTPPAFLILVRIAELLTQVIALYRPGIRACWDSEWPSFDDLAGTNMVSDRAIMDTLRLLYHAVTILSHRIFPDRTHLFENTPSFVRRKNSAYAILALYDTPSHRLPLPIVPYALSLALATFYSLLPQSREQFTRTCGLLERLSKYWWFAGAMAVMGRQALERMKVKEAATALRDLGVQGESSATGASHAASASTSNAATALGDGADWDGMDEWWLQLFPDLTLPMDLWDFQDTF